MAKKKILILVGGNPGTGKSTVAMEVAQKLHCGWIETDHLNDLTDFALESMGGHAQEYDSSTYKRVRPSLYAAIKKIVAAQLQVGISVVWSSPMQAAFLKENIFLPEMLKMAGEARAHFLPVWLYTDEQTTRQRLTERGCHKDQNKLQDWQGYAATIHFGPLPQDRMKYLQSISIPVACVENAPRASAAAVAAIINRSLELSRS